MKNFLIFFLAFILTLLGCKKNSSINTVNSNNPIIELGPNTILIDNSTSATLQSIDSTQIIFNGTTAQLEKLVPGLIIVSGITAKAPTGFLRRISSIVKNGTTYTLRTTEATLTEAFLSLHIDFTTPATSFTITQPNIIIHDGDGNNNTTHDQVKVNVSLGLTTEFHLKIDLLNFKLDYAKINGNFEGSLNTSVTAGGSVGSFSKEMNIYSQPIGIFSVPGTPIVITASFRVSLGANGSVNVQIVASDTKTSNINTYLEYQNNNWDHGFTRTMNNLYNFSGLSGVANAKVYVESAIDFKLWGSDWAKGSITSQGYLNASGQLLPTIDCELKAGISAGAEANLEFFGWTFAAVSYPAIFDYSKILYTCLPSNSGTVSDIDGNIYHPIVIGTQTWLMENLKVAHYRNGNPIPNITDNTQWYNVRSGACSFYNNNITNLNTYGRFYNAYAVKDSRGIAPIGYHIPTDAEWTTLRNYLGGNTAGGKMKVVGTSLWASPNSGATNSSGFSALPSGYRNYNGAFLNINFMAVWYSSSEFISPNGDPFFWNRYIRNDLTDLIPNNDVMQAGYSVRCIKD